jgi:hypothetical protein
MDQFQNRPPGLLLGIEAQEGLRRWIGEQEAPRLSVDDRDEIGRILHHGAESPTVMPGESNVHLALLAAAKPSLARLGFQWNPPPILLAPQPTPRNLKSSLLIVDRFGGLKSSGDQAATWSPPEHRQEAAKARKRPH